MLVGIDFSLNSPGICKFHDTHYSFHSLVNYHKDIQTLKKIPKAFEMHVFFQDTDAITFNYYTRTKNTGDYEIDQQNKIIGAELLSKSILDEIGYYVRHICAIEGFSYGSKGNSFIDLIMFNSILRYKLYKLFGEFHIFSPASVKQVAGKGNFNKNQMFDAFVNNVCNDAELENSLFFDQCVKNKDKCIDIKGNVKKPIDDLVDAYFITRKLRDIIK